MNRYQAGRSVCVEVCRLCSVFLSQIKGFRKNICCFLPGCSVDERLSREKVDKLVLCSVG